MRREERNNESSNSQKVVIKRILLLLKPYTLFLILSFVFAIISVGLTLYVPIIIGDSIDFIVEEGNVNFSGIKITLIRLLLVVIITAIAQWFMNLCNNRMTFYIVKDIREKTFRQLQIVPLKYVDSHQYGDIISRVVTDVEQLSDGLLMGFTQLFTGIITILGTLVFMLSINVKITLIVVLITPLSLFMANFIAKRTFSMFQLQSKTRGEMTSLVEEMVGNQKVVQAFGYEEEAKGDLM